MITEKELNTEAALLAASVAGQLNNIDKMMDGSRGNANRINLNAFINAAKTGGNYLSNHSDPANQGYVPENLVQNLIPDNSLFSKSSSKIPEDVVVQINSEKKQTTLPLDKSSPADPSKIEAELVVIRSLLEKINNNLSKMSGMIGKVFCIFTDKEKNNQDK
jgi:hypothetical protein